MENKELELEYLGFKNVKKEDKKIFIALGADYGNVGDMGITIAQKKLIEDAFPDRKIVEIPMRNAYEYENDVKNILNEDDICTIIGGGNLGNIYLIWEERRRFIIDLFKNNKIVSFPQSIDFAETEEGKKEFQKSIDVYGSHDNLTIFAREQKSYKIMKENFKNPVVLVPDIVFYLKENLNDIDVNRKNITLCLRNDGEKVTDDNMDKKLEKLFKSEGFENIIITDTCVDKFLVNAKERNSIFEECLKKFTDSKVVITDRLHGLIFSIVTNTPCIAFNNSNKKISSTYETWLKNTNLVKYLDNYDENKILEYVNELYNVQNPKIDLNSELNFNDALNVLKS